MNTHKYLQWIMVGCATFVSAVSVSRATEINWNVDAAGNWVDAAKWDINAVPGSGDTAVFSTLLTSGRTVTVDAGRAITGISFGSTNEYAFTIAGGSLLLANNGLIQNLADTGAHTDVISSPIVIQGDGGAATFSVNSPSNSVLAIDGDISGVATAGKTTTLTLTGTDVNADEHRVSGIISDGSEGGKLAITKSGVNTWVLNNANTFSGGVDIQGGVLIAENDTALGSGNVSQEPGATLALRGGVTVTGKRLELGGATSGMGSLDSFGGTNTWAGDITFTGVTPRVYCSDGTLIITGDVYVDSASGNPTIGGEGDGEFRGVVSGGWNISENKIRTFFRSSSDTGSWSFLNTNTFEGLVTCANGTIAINNDKSLGVLRTFSAIGLTLGHNATRGVLRVLEGENVTLHSDRGITIRGLTSDMGGIICTEAGATLTVNGVITDRKINAGRVTKTGPGTLVLNAENTFSNMLEVCEGTVILGQAKALNTVQRPLLKVDATLDLGGYDITTPELSGAGGTISNGTISVTTATIPGGANVIGQLTVPASPSLAGSKLTMDVAADGTCDRLNVTGDISVSGVALEIVDIGQLRDNHVYTLVQCVDGVRNGTFATHNLPDKWVVNYLDDRIQIYHTDGGTIMSVK